MRNVFTRHNVAYFGSITVALGILAFGASAAQRYYSGDLREDHGQRIHVYYDHQANTSVNAMHDGCEAQRCFIATQTAEDVYHSHRTPGVTGWFPSADDMYLRHPLVTSHPVPHHARHANVHRLVREYYGRSN